MTEIVLKNPTVVFARSAHLIDVHDGGAKMELEHTVDPESITLISLAKGHDGNDRGRGISIHTRSGRTLGTRRPLKDVLDDLAQLRPLSDILVTRWSAQDNRRRHTTAQALVIAEFNL